MSGNEQNKEDIQKQIEEYTKIIDGPNSTFEQKFEAQCSLAETYYNNGKFKIADSECSQYDFC